MIKTIFQVVSCALKGYLKILQRFQVAFLDYEILPGLPFSCTLLLPCNLV